jgi:hypothetical protein
LDEEIMESIFHDLETSEETPTERITCEGTDIKEEVREAVGLPKLLKWAMELSLKKKCSNQEVGVLV